MVDLLGGVVPNAVRPATELAARLGAVDFAGGTDSLPALAGRLGARGGGAAGRGALDPRPAAGADRADGRGAPAHGAAQGRPGHLHVRGDGRREPPARQPGRPAQLQGRAALPAGQRRSRVVPARSRWPRGTDHRGADARDERRPRRARRRRDVGPPRAPVGVGTNRRAPAPGVRHAAGGGRSEAGAGAGGPAITWSRRSAAPSCSTARREMDAARGRAIRTSRRSRPSPSPKPGPCWRWSRCCWSDAVRARRRLALSGAFRASQ